MIRQEPIRENPADSISWFDGAIECLLVGLLAFMPLAFGVVHAWSEEVVVLLSGAIVICFLLKLVVECDQRITWSWVYAAILAFLLLVVFQLVPLPVWLLRTISPDTAALRTELLGDVRNSDNSPGLMTLTFYPNATRHYLRLLLCVVGVFIVVLNVFRRPWQIKRLLLSMAFIGGFVAMISWGQTLFGNGRIYWMIPSVHADGRSGPFVNHSHYGQFMNLSIGVALGLIMVKLHEELAGMKKITPLSIFDYLGSSSARFLWVLIAIVVVGAATVFTSLSRGGMFSMFAAMVFTCVMLARRYRLRGHGWLMVLIALVAFICTLYTGFDAVYDRLATLKNLPEAGNGRLQILKDLTNVWAMFPVWGTGFGTYQVIYPMFDRSTIVGVSTHAENEYAQMMAETGLLGLGILVVFGIIVWISYFESTRKTGFAACTAAYGLGFGIIAVLVHSVTDFGQHLPANAVFCAVCCALLMALARMDGHHSASAVIVSSFRSRIFRTVVLVGICGIWLWAVDGAGNARLAETFWAGVVPLEKRIINNNWKGTTQEYADLITAAAGAVRCEPDNIRYRHWLNVYRWGMLNQTMQPNTTKDGMVNNSRRTIQEIVGEFHACMMLCPTYGPSYTMAGQIEKFILGNDAGAKLIRNGFRLAPCDPMTCYAAGYLDVIDGDKVHCAEKLNRAAQLDGRLFESVVDIYVNRLSSPRLAMAAAWGNAGHLGYVADVLEEMQYGDLAEEAREEAARLLREQCSKPDVSASAFVSLGTLCAKQGRYDAAIEYYRRALALDYGQVHWRLELAGLLAKAGSAAEALHEAQVCLRLRPQMDAANKLVGELSVNRSVIAEEVNRH